MESDGLNFVLSARARKSLAADLWEVIVMSHIYLQGDGDIERVDGILEDEIEKPLS